MTWFVFLLGLLIGLIVGYALDDLLIYRASRKGQEMKKPNNAWPWMLVATIAANTLVGALLIVTWQRTSDYFECSAQYDAQSSAASRARLEVAEEVDAAMDRLIQAVASEDRRGFREALSAYLELRKGQQAQRDRLPPPPEQVCGEVSN